MCVSRKMLLSAAVALVSLLLISHVTSSRLTMSQICNAENRKIYCTCNPSDHDIEGVDCVLLAEVSSPEDALWRVFGVSPNLKDIRLNSRPEGLLKYLPEVLFAQPHLRSAYVRHAHLHKLTSHVFRNSTTLVSLDLASNAIQRLDAHALSSLPALEELFLSDNELPVVRRHTLYDLPSLKLLSLDRNRIASLEVGALETLSRLSELELSSNRIKELKPGFFKGLSGLTRLDLGKNLVEHVPARAFHECPEVREIVLRENHIRSMDSKAFVGLSGLYTLYLSRNQLTQLHPHVFRPVSSLMYVDLRSNLLTTLTHPTVIPLNLTNNVTRIYLEDNRFVCDCSIEWMLDMFNLRHADHVSEWKEVRCFPPPTTTPEVTKEEGEGEEQRDQAFTSDLDGYFEGSSSRPTSGRRDLPIDQARGFLRNQHCPLPVGEVEELTLPSTERNDVIDGKLSANSATLPLLTSALLPLLLSLTLLPLLI